MQIIRSLALLAAVLSPLSALADTTYSYTGQPFTDVSGAYTTSNAITGQFTLAAPLAPSIATDTAITPLTFSFTDGLQTVTNTSTLTPDTFFTIQTNATGNISLWDIYITFTTPDGEAHLETLDDVIGPFLAVADEATHDHSSESSLIIDAGTNTGLPGTWTKATTPTAATPEPASLTLLATGLAATGTMLTRRRIRSRKS